MQLLKVSKILKLDLSKTKDAPNGLPTLEKIVKVKTSFMPFSYKYSQWHDMYVELAPLKLEKVLSAMVKQVSTGKPTGNIQFTIEEERAFNIYNKWNTFGCD